MTEASTKRPRARKSDGSVFETKDGRHRASLAVRDVVTGKTRRVWFSVKTPTEVRRKMQAARSEAQTVGRTPTLADHGPHWLRVVRHRVRPATMENYQCGIRAAIRGLGTLELARMKPADVEAWMGDLLAQGLMPSTVATYRRVLILALNDAERDGLVPKNVARLARPPRMAESGAASSELGEGAA